MSDVDIATVAMKSSRNNRSITLATDSHSSFISSCFSCSLARSVSTLIPSSSFSCVEFPLCRMLFSCTELMKSRDVRTLSPTFGATTRTSFAPHSISILFPLCSVKIGLYEWLLRLVSDGLNFRFGFGFGLPTRSNGAKISISNTRIHRGTSELGPVAS